MKKHLPLLVLVVVVALVIGGYLGYTSFYGENNEKTPQTVRDVKIPPAQVVTGDDRSSSNSQETGKKVSPDAIKDTNVPSVNPKAGEMIVQGEVKAVDVDKRVLTIDQQMDDNSVKISPNVPVNKDAIIRSKKEIISLAQIKTGDSVGIIVTKEGQARAVLVNY